MRDVKNMIKGFKKQGANLNFNRKDINQLLFCVVLISAILFVSVIMFKTDFIELAKWWLLFFAFSIITLPLTSVLFKDFFDKGYLFGKTVGLLLSALVLWQLSYLKILKFSFFSCLIAVIILCVGSFVFLKKSTFKTEITTKDIKIFAVVELVFLLFLVFWTTTGTIYPFLYFTEKPMDFGYLMAIRRSDFLPANDIWFAGESINYYYFGQYIFAFAGELLGSGFSANYSMAVTSVASLACGMTLSIGLTVAKDALAFVSNRVGRYIKTAFMWLFGIVAVFLVNFSGNAHSFFYGENHPANGFLKLLVQWGIVPVESDISTYYFFNSTRFIGHNPDNSDQTIHEFPAYSYILKDLHAHVSSIILVVLFIGVMYALFKAFFKKDDNQPIGVFCVATGILLGTMQMTNYWDYIIYTGFFGVILFCLVLFNIEKNDPNNRLYLVSVVVVGGACAAVFLFITEPIAYVLLYSVIAFLSFALYKTKNTKQSVILKIVAAFASSFAIANILALTFSLNFTMFSNSIKLVPTTTEPWQFVLVWGAHLVGVLVLIAIVATQFKRERQQKLLFATNVFMLAVAVYGVILIIVPEIVYVVDIYYGHVRSNTMFKFTYQGFILLSLALAFAFIKSTIFLLNSSFDQNRKRSAIVASLVAVATTIFMIAIVGTYPFVSFKQALTFYSGQSDVLFKGLNSGFSYVENMDAPEIPGNSYGELSGVVEVAGWFNETKEGEFNILEAYGASFSNYALVSSYTGLSTIIGQTSHELLWRHNPSNQGAADTAINERKEQVKAVYFFNDIENSREILKRYEIQYIVVGPLEKKLGEDMGLAVLHDVLLNYGEIVFHAKDVYVIQVT